MVAQTLRQLFYRASMGDEQGARFTGQFGPLGFRFCRYKIRARMSTCDCGFR